MDWQANSPQVAPLTELEQTSYMGMGDLSEKLKTELQLMALTSSKTKGIVEKGNLEKIARHKEALAQITSEVDELKLQVEKVKLESGETVDEIQKWGQEV